MKVDPATLKFEELIRHPSIDGFGVSTVAIQVAKELWLGSVRGDRIAIFPLEMNGCCAPSPSEKSRRGRFTGATSGRTLADDVRDSGIQFFTRIVTTEMATRMPMIAKMIINVRRLSSLRSSRVTKSVGIT